MRARSGPWIALFGDGGEGLAGLPEALGRALATAGLRLGVPGASPGGLRVARAFSELDPDPRHLRVYLRSGRRKGPAPGTLIFPGRRGGAVRAALVRRSEAALVVGGELAASAQARLALERGLPLLPVGGTGGTAAQLARELGARLAERLPPEELRALQRADSPQALAQAAVEALQRLLRGPSARRARPRPLRRVLFCASSPGEMPIPRVMGEYRALRHMARTVRTRRLRLLEPVLAATPSDLREALLEARPHILHFSGHGSALGDIVLEDARGRSSPLSLEVLARLAALGAPPLEGVVLNSCFSARGAEALSRAVPWVVAMRREIRDAEAIDFACAFYHSLALGRSVDDAFEAGRVQLMAAPGAADFPARLLRARPGDRDPSGAPAAPEGAAEGPERSPAAPRRPARRVDLKHFPLEGRGFVDRERELAALEEAWRGGGARVLALVGWAGSGKTALLSRWIAALARRKFDGAQAVFAWSFAGQGLEGNPGASAERFLAAALRSLGAGPTSSEDAWDQVDRLAALLRARRCLLVLDGVETLVHAAGEREGHLRDPAVAGLLTELAASGRSLCVLSARPPFEELAPLSGEAVRRLDLPPLGPSAGECLLRARGVEGSARALRRAHEALSGHALSLALFGSYVADVCGGDVEAAPRDLAEEGPGAPGARRLVTAYDERYGPSPERALLRCMGLFDRPADLTCLQELKRLPEIAGLTEGIAGAPNAALERAAARLARAGLVRRAPGPGGASLEAHPLVRSQYRSLLSAEHAAGMREAHSRLYKVLRARAGTAARTAEELSLLFQVVWHGVHAGRHVDALQEVFAPAIGRVSARTSDFRFDSLHAHLDAVALFFEEPWVALRAGFGAGEQLELFKAAGYLLRAKGRFAEAERAALRGARIAGEAGEAREAAVLWGMACTVQAEDGRLSEAEGSARAAVGSADRSGDDRQRREKRAFLGRVLHLQGRREEAARLYREAERGAGGEPSPLHSVMSLWIGELLLERGRREEALERIARDRAEARGEGSEFRGALAELQAARLAPVGARAGALSAALGRVRACGQVAFGVLGLLWLSEAEREAGRAAEARAACEEALSSSQRFRSRLLECDARALRARLLEEGGDREGAGAERERAREMARTMGYGLRLASLEDRTPAR